jgi:hypothetical protein
MKFDTGDFFLLRVHFEVRQAEEVEPLYRRS